MHIQLVTKLFLNIEMLDAPPPTKKNLIFIFSKYPLQYCIAHTSLRYFRILYQKRDVKLF